jgi:hypothetical protein
MDSKTNVLVAEMEKALAAIDRIVIRSRVISLSLQLMLVLSSVSVMTLIAFGLANNAVILAASALTTTFALLTGVYRPTERWHQYQLIRQEVRGLLGEIKYGGLEGDEAIEAFRDLLRARESIWYVGEDFLK